MQNSTPSATQDRDDGVRRIDPINRNAVVWSIRNARAAAGQTAEAMRDFIADAVADDRVVPSLATPAPPMTAPGVEADELRRATAELEAVATLIERGPPDDVLLEKDVAMGHAKCIRSIMAALSVPTAPAQSDDRVKALEEALREIRDTTMAVSGKSAGEVEAYDRTIARAALAPVHTSDTAQGGGEGR